MHRLITITTGLLLIFIALAGVSAAEQEAVSLPGLQQQWAVIKYQTSEDQRAEQFKALAETAEKLAMAHPDSAEPLIWQAIILSTYAGEAGGLSALSAVKKARDLLLAAIELDPQALEGSAYTSLGSLYYQVPGWPLSFGSDDRAREYLEKALSINPNGIDPNYFYGDFLLDQGEYSKAIEYFNIALKAPPRPGRALADSGRKEEIRQALAKAQSKL